ncbi:VOC family protein [Peribacillus sp. SI8-4]|uniref:VOC family protein n=1 Tax=Peribacillus sp. SI8-4 TaxID=3048009 RepID=UPI0025545066|nr:VOC family protein [Peribacillus sp. SI8-4]
MKHPATPYLTFNGQAKEALSFYEEIFQAEITELQTYGEADFPTPEEANDLVLHAKIKKGDFLIMISDTFPGNAFEVGNHVSFVLECESEPEIQRLYDSFCAKGSSLMELQDTFWGAKYGRVRDQFGVQWDLNFTR